MFLFLLSFLLCWLFYMEFLKEMGRSGLVSPALQQILTVFLGLYFIFGFFLFSFSLFSFSLARPFPHSFIFLALPALFLLSFAFCLQKQKRQTLFERMRDLLIPVSAKMKLGSGFMDAWEKSAAEMDKRGIQEEILKISEALLFQKNFQHPDKRIEDILHHLSAVRSSPHPLKRLKHLEQKLKTEQAFYRKAGQVLLQLRIQSGVLSCLYFGLLIWTLIFYGSKYSALMLSSFFCFATGLFWILKTGRKMKWSL